MATAKIKEQPQQTSDTFTWTLANGDTLVVGKPQGVLKLKIREILPEDLRKDPEMVAMATAFLSVRSVNGNHESIRSFLHFQGFMQRFGSDEALDEFMNKYQSHVNPEQAAFVKKLMLEAIEQKDLPIKEYIDKKSLEYQREQLEKVRD